MIRTLLTTFVLASPVHAQEQLDYVTSNVLSAFYHELGHALIDVLRIPVLGQEEDAADVLSVVLLDAFWEEDIATGIARDTADAYLASAEENAAEEPAYWDVHSLDEQRFYSHVCLFYGANPATRKEFVAEYDLPGNRAEGCEDEFALATESWGSYLDAIQAPGDSFIYIGPLDNPVGELLGYEVADLNAQYTLPEMVTVTLADCGEANAFYDPSERAITICTEYVDYFAAQADSR